MLAIRQLPHCSRSLPLHRLRSINCRTTLTCRTTLEKEKIGRFSNTIGEGRNKYHSHARAFYAKPITRSYTTSSPSSSSSSSSSSSRSRRRLPSLLSSILLASGATWLCYQLFPFESLDAASNEDDKTGVKGKGAKGPASPLWLCDSICNAAGAGDLNELQRLYSKYHPVEGANLTHRYGWTVLQAAVAQDRLEVVEWLLKEHGEGLDINKPDRYTHNARNLDTMITKHSARSTAFPELWPNRSANGLTALHYAVLFARARIVELLVEHGADLDQTDGNGLKPDGLIDWSRMEEDESSPTSPTAVELHAKRERMKQVCEYIRKSRKERDAERQRREKEERIRFPLELKLKEQMVGQEVPILSVAAALRRRENGWFDPAKPLVLLMIGSSGVGKSMLAKLIAEYTIKDRENGFIRIDMSEYQAKHEMARLIGSPPGYVGHEEGGQLTTKLAKCPEAVVLLDEIEKADPNILTLMLQVFDEGRLTDGKGNTINCPKAIFIMTSNLVQEEIAEAIQEGYHLRPKVSILEHLDQTTKLIRERGGVTTLPLEAKSSEKKAIPPPPSSSPSSPSITDLPPPASGSSSSHSSASTGVVSESALKEELTKVSTDTESFLRFIVHPILKRSFKRDEFLGRINDIIVFHPFNQNDLEATVQMELSRWAKRAKERHSIDLKWTPGLVSSLTGCYDERYGYRSVMYGVEKRVVNVLASAHEREKIRAGDRVLLDVEPTDEPGQHQQVIIKSITQPSEDEEGNKGRKKFLGIF